MKLLILNGPNLNRLGSREPATYGNTHLKDIEKRLHLHAQSCQQYLDCFQSNHEGSLIDRIHLAADQKVGCIIFNPGAFTHTSIALRDAIIASQIPMIEVHISAVFQREPFRHHSYFADIAVSRLVGFGALGYDYALVVALALVKLP